MYSPGNDQYLVLKLPDPYLSSLKANYIVKDQLIYLISTGDWGRKALNTGCAIIGEQLYSVSEVPISEIIKSFEEKYGKDHAERHKLKDGTGLCLKKTESCRHSRYEILEREFDHVASFYEDRIRSSTVQRYMRERTGQVLRKYIVRGTDVLEIGSGVLLETWDLQEEVNLTCAELSSRMIELSREKYLYRNMIPPEFIKTGSGVLETGKKFDLIFSSFGYIDLEDIRTIEETLNNNLRNGGVLILSYWNKIGLLDGFISALCGRTGYLKEKLRGEVSTEKSRFSTVSRPKKPGSFRNMMGFREIQREGICILIPPYNFSASEKISSSFPGILRLDSMLGKIPLIRDFSDYIISVMVKE